MRDVNKGIAFCEVFVCDADKFILAEFAGVEDGDVPGFFFSQEPFVNVILFHCA